MPLRRLKGTAEAQEIAAALRDEGALIVDDVIGAETLDALNGELAPWIARCKPAEDEFSGLQTQRLVALAARSPSVSTIEYIHYNVFSK
jgi:hypothetical protein